MGKRVSSGADGAAAFRKRAKITHDVPTGEEIGSSDQLRQLLTFDQDLRRARHGLQSLKMLLDDIIATEGPDRSAKLAILQQYLDSVKPRNPEDDSSVFLEDIMEMWSFATQANDDGVMSAVAVVLALVLQVVSGSLELVPHGLGVCHTLLQERQLKALSRNLSSEKVKAFIISPTLRLLREAVCLDGGAFARKIVRARNSTFSSLGRNLEIGFSGEGQEEASKASVRTNAVRFFLSCLKYLHSDGRKELLSQKDLLSHLTFMIKNDPPHLVLEILDSLKAHVLMDSKIPRDVKFRSFNTKTLMRVLALYNYVNTAGEADERDIVSDRAHKFLIYICTTPGVGILYPSKGLYPKETDEELSSRSAKGDNSANQDGDVWEDKFRDGVPVFNFVLSEFVTKLRPWSSLKHNELLVAIFKAAPELIADYFFNNRSFTFEPKLSMTWIGYAAFLFNTMSIPLPASFGDAARYASTPPPTSILLDNIIPLPINQKVLIRCLSPKSNLTSFFATRILVIALEKLAAAIKMHEEASRSKNKTWIEASRRLVDAFCQRIPDMKEVVRSYKSTPAENVLHKTMASRLLRLYYEVIPRVALSANFDVSPFFVDVLKSLYNENSEPEARSFGFIELENLVSIANYSPGMRWFSKTENLRDGVSLAPFTALLQLLCDGDNNISSQKLNNVLAEVAVESQLVPSSSGLVPLLRALRCTVDNTKPQDMAAIWTFLDNCITRCASSPIKYLDLLETYATEAGSPVGNNNIALLTVTILEQLPFATSSASSKAIGRLAKFVSLYFNASFLLEGETELLRKLHHNAAEHLSTKSASLKSLGDSSETKSLKKRAVDYDEEHIVTKASQPKQPALDDDTLEQMLHTPFTDKEDTAALIKWSSKSVEDLIEDDWVANLVRLLSSEHTNIRKEALTNILKMAAKFEQSTYEEKTQIWLLLSELAESSKTQVDQGPVPSAFTAFAIHAVDIIKNPLHPLYPKVNAYMARSPVWSVEKLPLAHDILHGEPSEDDKYYTEIAWLLTYLLDGLRGTSDLSVFHKHRWFEKILALGSNPYLRSTIKTKILKIIYRATCIEGGSTTLITRFGVISWLDAQRAACETQEDAAVYEGLMKRTWNTCDQKRVASWSKGGVEQILAGNHQS